MHAKAKRIIIDCYYEENKEVITQGMKTKLRETIGETNWNKANDYLEHYLKQLKHEKNSKNNKGEEKSKRKEEKVLP